MCRWCLRVPGGLRFVVVVGFSVFTAASRAVFLHPTEGEAGNVFHPARLFPATSAFIRPHFHPPKSLLF